MVPRSNSRSEAGPLEWNAMTICRRHSQWSAVVALVLALAIVPVFTVADRTETDERRGIADVLVDVDEMTRPVLPPRWHDGAPGPQKDFLSRL